MQDHSGTVYIGYVDNFDTTVSRPTLTGTYVCWLDVTFVFSFSQLSVLLEIGHASDLQGCPLLVCRRGIHPRQARRQQRAGLLGSPARPGEAISELVRVYRDNSMAIYYSYVCITAAVDGMVRVAVTPYLRELHSPPQRTSECCGKIR